MGVISRVVEVQASKLYVRIMSRWIRIWEFAETVAWGRRLPRMGALTAAIDRRYMKGLSCFLLSLFDFPMG
jgi:hypothetical protein